MPESKQSSSSIGASAVWILLAAAGTYFVVHQAPLEGTRPPTSEATLHEPASLQDIEARLWQDPFAAVADKLIKSNDLKLENCGKKIEIDDHCRSPLNAAGEQPLVLVASMSGAPYSEDHEYGRRLRYAILAGLERQGFVPQEADHLGFFWPRAVEARPKNRLPEVVPFERFEGKNGAALLLWFDEDVLKKSPLKQFDEFFCRILKPKMSGSGRLNRPRVLGPEFSTTLREMAREAGEGWSSKFCSTNESAEFYVFSATAADTALIPPADYLRFRHKNCRSAGDCLSQFFSKHNVRLYRMTVTDAGLAGAMRDELALRWPRRAFDEVKQKVLDEAAYWLPTLSNNVSSMAKRETLAGAIKALGFVDESHEHHVVLISEWDSLYGQSLPDAMAACLGPSTGGACNRLDEKFVHRYSYLRGLDGQVPGAGGPNSGDAVRGTGKNAETGGNQDKGSKDRAKPAPGAKPSDRAEGQGQYDYLRRLGDRVVNLDTRLRSGLDKDPTQRSSNGIAAVGVLGSDRYDKLLILQALRPLLPNALFFTTDLDAQLWHPTALPHTRNLLIASSFGLQLSDELQGEIPPFRSSYQTGAFLATQAAIKRAADGLDGRTCTWMEPPVLFEVGLSGPFQLPTVWTGGKPSLRKIRCEPPAKGIHPEASEMFPPLSRGYPLAAAVTIAVLGLGISLSCGFLRPKTWHVLHRSLDVPGRRFWVIALAVALFVGLGLFVVALASAISIHWPGVADRLTSGGQPMILLDGLSTWPTIVLRAATLVLCFFLFVHAFWWLNDDFRKVADKMEVKAFWEKIEETERKREGRPWTKFVRYFSYPMSDGATSDYKERFWGPYVYQATWPARIWRTVVAVAVFLIFWGILELVFGNPPAPSRGPMSFWLYTGVSLALNITTLFLTLFVADATLLYRQVVKALLAEADNRPSVWPDDTQRKFGGRVGLSQFDLEYWIDLVFISKRTKCVTTLIYFPFIIVALVIISRSGLFANYAPSLPEMLVMALGLLIVTGSAVALRQAAEASRAKAHRRLNDQIMLARQSAGGESRAAQLELLSRRVEELHEGALTPFSQQPLLRAMLLPLGSFGGTALVEYLLLPGLS